MLTLFVTPVFFTYMEQFREWLGRRRGKGRPMAEVVEPRAPEREEERIPAAAAMRSITPGV